jgi:pSer/pThr/pTyr-binding forkhead associated (FHA) protein
MPYIEDAPSKLVLSLPGGGKQEFTLAKASTTIGRAPTSDILLPDSKVSRIHARVHSTVKGFEVEDLDSANGIRVNGAVVARASLAPGDVLAIGDCVLRLEISGPEPDPEMTQIESEQDLDETLVQTPLTVCLEETTLPRVAVHTDEKTWEVQLAGDSLTIGRGPENDIALDFLKVSRHHAVLERKRDLFVLRDLQSANGTWVGNQRVSTAVVNDGAAIEIGPAKLVFKRGFAANDLSAVETRRSGPTRRAVVVVPGFAGSNLWRGSEKIWPVPRMLLTNPGLLRMDEPLEARGLVNEVVIIPSLLRQHQYSVLTDYLKENLGYEAGADLMEFGYDFRQDNRASAKHLASAIDGWNVLGPITIIAHSMGCLVARYYIERLGGKKRVERVIFLGGPHSGTPYAFASLLKGPGLLPLGILNARLRDVLLTFPSWYQILPTYRFASDQRTDLEVLSEESWLLEEYRPLLRLAREFRSELGTRSSVPSVCVFGYGLKTITGAKLEREPLGMCQKADLVVTARGDGTIPESSAVMEGAEIHPVRQHHGALYVDNDVKMRLKLELTRQPVAGDG